MIRGPLGSEHGSVVAEFAVALPAVVLVLILGMGALGAGARHVRLQDAAADAARLAARGEDDGRVAAAVSAAVAGATSTVATTDDLVCVSASAEASPGLPLMLTATSARSPAADDTGTLMAGSIAAVGIVTCVATISVGFVLAGSAAVFGQRLAGTADAAALAAADAASGAVNGIPCESAASIASAAGAELSACEIDVLTVTVTVSALFGRLPATASARAGPPP